MISCFYLELKKERRELPVLYDEFTQFQMMVWKACYGISRPGKQHRYGEHSSEVLGSVRPKGVVILRLPGHASMMLKMDLMALKSSSSAAKDEHLILVGLTMAQYDNYYGSGRMSWISPAEV